MRRQITEQPDGSWRRELVIENHELDCVKDALVPHLFWAATGRDDFREVYREHEVRNKPLRLVGPSFDHRNDNGR